MKGLRRFLRRLTSWAGRQEQEERLRHEIEEHIAMQAAEYEQAGISPVEARRQAILKFGAVQAIREDLRDQTRLPLIETLIRDTRHALRRLRKAPAFTITTVLTLALGIGATTSIFTLVYAVLLKSLAVANPSELLRLGTEARCCYWGGYSQDKEFSLVSHPLYQYFRGHTEAFRELAAFSANVQLFGVRRAGKPDPAQTYSGEWVSGNYFNMFGIKPHAGRVLAPSDDTPNAAPVAVMSYRLWRERYGSDPSVIGSVFDLSQKPFTVVGITPPGFYGDSLRPNPPDFFLPLWTESYDGDGDLNKPDTHWLNLIGRMRPGARPASIQAEMRVELKQWLRSHWGDMDANDRTRLPEQTLFLRPGGAGITAMRDQYEHWLQILVMVSGLVLLIVCANIANLMLVRGLEARRQTALSTALGARPWGLVRQALSESILLSLFGGAAGLAIAFAGTTLILRFVFPSLGEMGQVPIDASPSMPVLIFACCVSFGTGIAFGIAPAWMATRIDPIEALRGANRSTTRTASFHRKALVVAQAALALVLLSASGLLTTALHKLEEQDFGFDQNRRIIVNYDPRLASYPAGQLTPLYRRIQDAIKAIPGVADVALCIYSPLGGNNWGGAVWVDGQPPPGPNDNEFTSFDRVTAGYFTAIGTPILRGRGLTDQDTANTPHVAVINEAFARRFFKNEDPIGKYFGKYFGRLELGSARQYEIVGVAKDARYLSLGLDQAVSPFFFLPEAQHDVMPTSSKEADPGSHYLRDIVVVPRAGVTIPFDRLRAAITSVDPNLPLISIHTLREQVAGQFRQQRLIARLTSFFGLLSLVLASIGLYGVTAYNAGRRTNEIGVRMALGAGRREVLALILRGAFTLILAGLMLGLPLTFAAGRFLGTQLLGGSPYDPLVTLVAVVTLSCSGLAAALIPAFRASSLAPVESLRAE